MDINNTHLIKLMNNVKETYSPESQIALLDAMFKSTILVPTHEQVAEDRILPLPVALSTSDGKLFQPVYIDEDSIDYEAIEAELNVIPMPFTQLATIIVRQNEMYKQAGEGLKPVSGIVINPSKQAIAIETGVIAMTLSNMQLANLTDESYAVFVRCELEQHYLPALLFEKGDELVSMLLKDQGQYVYELGRKPFPSVREFPYTADDYKVNAVRLNNDCVIVKIDMPDKYRVLGTAEAVYLVVFKELNLKRYFAIVTEPVENDEPKRIFIEIMPNKKAYVIGDAPEEGQDIDWILNFITKK